VLVLEDDKDVRSLLELGLEARGAQVVAVASREEFSNLLKRRPVIDAALVDLSPIKHDLAAALAELKAACPQARLLLISGQPEGVPAEAESQFVEWVRKPFEMAEVVQAVSKATSKP
jgi:DNA-binding NtrC family response regulator